MADIYPITWETEPTVIPTIDEYYLRAEDCLGRCIRALTSGVSPTSTLNNCIIHGSYAYHDEGGGTPHVDKANTILERINVLVDEMNAYSASLRDLMVQEKEKEKTELIKAINKKLEELRGIKAGQYRTGERYQNEAARLNQLGSPIEEVESLNRLAGQYYALAEETGREIKKLEEKLVITQAVKTDISGYIDSNGAFHPQNLPANVADALADLQNSREQLAGNIPQHIVDGEAAQGFEESCGVYPNSEKLEPVDYNNDGEIDCYRDKHGHEYRSLSDAEGLFIDDDGNWYVAKDGYKFEVTHTYDSTKKTEVVNAGVGYKPHYETDENGYPTEVPQDFVIDSHEKLNYPGWGSVEPRGGEEIIFHYDPVTNKWYNLTYYEAENGGRTVEQFDPNSKYSYTVEEMNTYEVRGGCRFGWGAEGTEIVQ